MDSILTSIKKLLLIDAEDHSFDTDVMVHINSAIGVLYDLGIDNANGFSVKDDTQTWQELTGSFPNPGMIEDFVYLKVKPVFDSSTMSKETIESFGRAASELEWRISSRAEALRRNVQATN